MPGRHQLRVSFEIGLGAGELRLVLLLHCLGLGQRRLVGSRVDLQEQVALLDFLALLEIDLYYLAVDPALDRNHIVGLHRADPVQKHRNILRGDGPRGDRNGRPRGLCRCRRAGAEAQQPDRGQRDDRADCTPHHRKTASLPAQSETGIVYHRRSLRVIRDLWRESSRRDRFYRRAGISIGAQLWRPDIRQSSSRDFSLSSRTITTPAMASARIMIKPIRADDRRWSAPSSSFPERWFIRLPKRSQIKLTSAWPPKQLTGIWRGRRPCFWARRQASARRISFSP